MLLFGDDTKTRHVLLCSLLCIIKTRATLHLHCSRRQMREAKRHQRTERRGLCVCVGGVLLSQFYPIIYTLLSPTLLLSSAADFFCLAFLFISTLMSVFMSLLQHFDNMCHKQSLVFIYNISTETSSRKECCTDTHRAPERWEGPAGNRTVVAATAQLERTTSPSQGVLIRTSRTTQSWENQSPHRTCQKQTAVSTTNTAIAVSSVVIR